METIDPIGKLTFDGKDVDQLFAEAKSDNPSLRNCQFLLRAGQIRKFEHCCTQLQKLLNEVKKDFPEAVYFVEGESGLHLMLGNPESDGDRLSMHRSAASSIDLEISGGSI